MMDRQGLSLGFWPLPQCCKVFDLEGLVISVTHPCCPTMLSSKLMDTNNDATPKLTSHHTTAGKCSTPPGVQVTMGTGTKHVTNDAALNINHRLDSDHANDKGTIKKVTALKVKHLCHVMGSCSMFPQAPGPSNRGTLCTSSHVTSVTTVGDGEDKSTTNGLRSHGTTEMKSVQEGSWGDEGWGSENGNENST
ncbi:hypothetical protein PAXRUDRAFT_25701 [Paxillus rubicundulus Ve08.2h10]|uniref:Unplaced genomic scaffold scaffold_251, whole genome shotgun sequence n=1 Tax=Paxillus rubicundulus Ve08.2h10 TaxID=930991 RepID=A0A0D0DCN9_9AGAM|nr:hypothetical protein PAXRUDRAFT_25701 [Paxillus rubicundulus Ve08.2h10]